MRVVQSLTLAFCVQLSFGLSIPVKKSDLLKRQSEDSVDGQLGCISMKQEAGEYYHISEGSPEVCAMYMIGAPDTLIQLEFTEFNVDCESGGALGLLDGWELQMEYFPTIEDTGDSYEDRYKQFCGINTPTVRTFVSSQNAALLHFRIPEPGQGFRLRMSYIHNPQPCNVLANMQEAGVMSIKNYGLRRNCTISFLYPENLLVLNVDIGTTLRGPVAEYERGLSLRCRNEAGGDWVEFLYGNHLDIDYMNRRLAFCGLRSKAARRPMTLGCRNTAVRLVSSGAYYNSIVFTATKPSPEQLEAFNRQC